MTGWEELPEGPPVSISEIIPFAIATALAVGVTLGIDYIRNWIARRHTAEEDFRLAIQSDDIGTIGNYLGYNLGDIEIGAYLRSNDVRRKTDSYLSKIAALVEAPEQITPETAQAKSSQSGTENLERRLSNAKKSKALLREAPLERLPEAIDRAIAVVQTGEIWNALAFLRRDLESQLTSSNTSAERHRFRIRDALPNSPAGIREALGRFWRKASEAIHGIDVTQEEAWEAIEDALIVYRELQRQAK